MAFWGKLPVYFCCFLGDCLRETNAKVTNWLANYLVYYKVKDFIISPSVRGSQQRLWPYSRRYQFWARGQKRQYLSKSHKPNTLCTCWRSLKSINIAGERSKESHWHESFQSLVYGIIEQYVTSHVEGFPRARLHHNSCIYSMDSAMSSTASQTAKGDAWLEGTSDDCSYEDEELRWPTHRLFTNNKIFLTGGIEPGYRGRWAQQSFTATIKIQ